MIAAVGAESGTITRPGHEPESMLVISIYGAGTTCVIVDGCDDRDGAGEHYSHERGARRARWRGDLVAPDGEAVRVYAIFDGCWHLSIGQAGRECPIPTWPHAITQHPTIPYSALLEIQAPSGTRLVDIWPAGALQ